MRGLHAANRSGTGLAVAASANPGARQFAFVANAQPVVRGAIGGVVVLSLLAAWAWWSGRLQHADATYLVVMASIAAGSCAFVVWRLWRSARAAALTLGYIEVDDEGVRWHRGDEAPGFEVRWNDVERATVDARNSIVVLFPRGASPVVVGVLSQHGVPSGAVVPERFEEIAEFVDARVPSAPHVGAGNGAAARPSLLLGLLSVVAAGALYGANVAIAEHLHWTRWLVPMPAFVGAVGLLVLLAGVRIRTGKGPLISPLYGRAYRGTVVRFLVVASIANFVLVSVANTLANGW